MQSEAGDEDGAGDDAALEDEELGPFDPELYSINYWILHGEVED